MFEVQKTDKKMNIGKVEFFRGILDRALKIGTELEIQFKDCPDDRGELNEEFGIESTNMRLNKYGVCEVKSDGSLSEGYELITAGRGNVGFIPLFNQYKTIMRKLDQYEPYVHSRASWHNHILIAHENRTNELEFPLDRIYMENYIEAMKRFLPSLLFMTSTVNQDGAYTRRNNFCYHMSMYEEEFNLQKSMAESNDNRYRALNTNAMRVNNEKDVNVMHFELRFPDCNITPAAMASLNILERAIMYYVLDYCYLGYIIPFANEEEKKRAERTAMFKNNGRRTKDISDYIEQNYSSLLKGVDEDYFNSERISVPVQNFIIEELREDSKKMLEELKPYIMKLDKHGFAWKILNKLAINPISIMRDTMDMGSIDKDLENCIKLEKTLIEDEIYRMILQRKFREVKSPQHWVEQCSAIAMCKEGEEGIKKMINDISKIKPVGFCHEYGFYFK